MPRERQEYDSHVWQRTFWLGVPTVKYPTDLIAYQEIIWETQPELIVECGTHLGGVFALGHSPSLSTLISIFARREEFERKHDLVIEIMRFVGFGPRPE